MSTVVIVKRDDGKLYGLGEVSERAYEGWRAHVRSMSVGETVTFSWKKPRSLPFHRRFFAMLGALSSRQEMLTDDQLRSWLIVGAGYADMVPGPAGRMVAMPKSIAFDKLEEDDFRILVDAVWAFLRTEHAIRFLWPLASYGSAAQAVENLLAEFD